MLQVGRVQLGQPYVHLVAHLRIHGIRQADSSPNGQRFDARGDVHPVPIHVGLAMDHVTDMDADAHVDVALGGLRGIAGDDRALDLHRALGCLERAGKLDQEPIAGGLDLAAVEQRELRAQQSLLLGEQLQRQRLVMLGECAVAHHVGEHDGGQLALLGVFRRHGRIKPDRARKETTDRPVRTKPNCGRQVDGKSDRRPTKERFIINDLRCSAAKVL